MPESTFNSRSLDQTEQIAAYVVKLLGRGGIVALEGDLGAGKTQFVRGMVKALGGGGRMVHSPTYMLLHTHPLPADRRLYHLDAYRVSSAEDFVGIGFDELLTAADEGDIIAIEWPSRVAELIPSTAIRVTITHTATDRRQIRVSAP